MKTLIKNGRVASATDHHVPDIFIDGAMVTAIGKSLDIEAAGMIDAAGKFAIPGGIDADGV